MRNKILTIVMSAMIISGCASTTPVVNTVIQKVEVPVMVPCQITPPAPPQYYFDAITAIDELFDKVKALLADRNLHLGYEEELRAALTACTGVK